MNAVHYIFQITPWSLMELGGHLVGKFGTAPKQNHTQSTFFEISTSNLDLF